MPKLVQKQGYKVLQPTGWDLFGQFLGTMMQGLQQQQAKKQENAQRADQVMKEQANMRLALADLASKDPETYNTVIKDQSILALMDPQRAGQVAQVGESMFEKWIREKNAKKVPLWQGPLQPGQTALGKGPILPVASAESVAAARLRRAAEGAQAHATISTSELQRGLSDWRKQLITSDQFVDRMIALEGRLPSVGDLQADVLAKNPELLREQIPGTIEWQTRQARVLAAEMTERRQIKDPTDLQRIRARAEYLVGLRPDAPEPLPPQYQDLELELSTRAQRLREEQFGFDQRKYITDTNINTLQMTVGLMGNGVPPMQAGQLVDRVIKSGDFSGLAALPPDRKRAFEEEAAQLRIVQLNLDIEKLRADDPEVAALYKLLEQIPIADRQKTGAKELQAIVQKLMTKHGWEPEMVEAGFWSGYWPNFRSGNEVRPGAGYMKPGEAQPLVPRPEVREQIEVLITPAVNANITPELTLKAQELSNTAVALLPSLTAVQKSLLDIDAVAIRNAMTNKDAVALARAIDTMERNIRAIGGQ